MHVIDVCRVSFRPTINDQQFSNSVMSSHLPRGSWGWMRKSILTPSPTLFQGDEDSTCWHEPDLLTIVLDLLLNFKPLR